MEKLTKMVTHMERNRKDDRFARQLRRELEAGNTEVIDRTVEAVYCALRGWGAERAAERVAERVADALLEAERLPWEDEEAALMD